MINNFDFIILSETWKRSNIQIEGFETFVTNIMKTGKYIGNYGGLALIYKLKFDGSQYQNPHQISYGLKSKINAQAHK